MYQIGIDIGGTNVKIGLLNEALELCAEISIPFPHTTAEDMAAIEALDGGESLFFSHYDPKTVEWFMSIL